MDNKSSDAFRTISEVAEELDLPQHVLRFWETRFREIAPMKRGGGRRYYRPGDIDLLRGIRHLLYGEGYTIRGVQRILREQGAKFVQIVWQEGAPQPPHGRRDQDELEDAGALPDMLGGEHGLRDKLASVIGRDLGDCQDDGSPRDEPLFESTPMPRIKPDDRALHAGDESRPAPPAMLATPTIHLGREQLHKLHAALHELAECRKLVDVAAKRAEME